MRKALPIVVIGGVAFVFLSQFFDWSGGFNATDRPEADTSQEVADEVVDTIQDGLEGAKQLVADEKVDPSQLPENSYVGLDYVDVLIDGDRYLLRVNDDSGSTAESSATALGNGTAATGSLKSVAEYEVVRLARELPGDSTGVKVRIFRTPNAIAEAERDLLTALYAAGLKDDQVDLRTRLVE